MGNGSIHAPDRLPLVIVGGGLSRVIVTIRTAERTPVGNVWLSAAHHFDIPLERVWRKRGDDRSSETQGAGDGCKCLGNGGRVGGSWRWFWS